ncbi:alpha/beta fold hydrolase [Bacteroidota bacterium]
MIKLLKILAKIILYFVAILVVLFITFYLLTIGDYKVAETVEQDKSIPHITLDGVVFHCETFGDPLNPLVIALHGGPGNDYRYILDLRALSNEYFVVFYDQRGTGLSPRVGANEHTIDNAISDLNAFVDHFGQGDKVNLIGHSWGGMLASAYIGRYPEKVDKVVLAEPGFLTTERANDFMKKTNNMMPKFSFGLLWDIGKIWFESLHVDGPDDQAASDYFLANIITLTGEGNPLAGYYCNNDMANAAFTQWRLGSLTQQTLFMAGFDEDGNYHINLIDGVEKFRNKILFIASGCNTIIGVEHQKKQMKYFPNTELKIIENAGHTMFGEKPEESVRVIREYFDN